MIIAQFSENGFSQNKLFFSDALATTPYPVP
jgi:hypothetical protein